MPDDLPPPEGGDDLMFQAMLYVSGELEPAEAAAFELRLSEDQTARDALCQAVELAQHLAGEAAAGPDPAYRSRVRRRLRQRRRQRLSAIDAPGAFISQPAFWSVMGAAVAVVLMTILTHIISSLEQPATPTAPAVNVNMNVFEMAVTWADLHNNDRLEQVQDEQRKRQQRAADRPRLAPGDLPPGGPPP